MAKVYPKSAFWMHAFDWPERTLKIYTPYSMYFACHNDLRSAHAVLTNLLGDIPKLFATFEPWRKYLRRVTSAKGSQKSEFWMIVHVFDWLEQTDKIGWNILPARMTCVKLCCSCQIVWEHFPQLYVKFEPSKRQLGHLFMTSAFF